MKNKTYILFLSGLILLGCKTDTKSPKIDTEKVVAQIIEIKVDVPELKIHPITHATAVIEFNNNTIYLDPTGGAEAFKNYAPANIILITDIHGDHMDIKTLETLDTSTTKFVAPKAVADKLPETLKQHLIIINNGESKTISDILIEAIPMYNLREEALKFHKKGRGNGYVLTLGKERIYFSGDTEDIPEMRALKNIDKAFVCMNLPYTMTIESAADGVLAFAPKKVYPYHYRGTEGKSDVAKFKELVTKGNPDIEVIQWNWYPNE